MIVISIWTLLNYCSIKYNSNKPLRFKHDIYNEDIDKKNN